MENLSCDKILDDDVYDDLDTPCSSIRIAASKMQKQGTQGLLDDAEDGGCTVAVRTQAKFLLLIEVVAPFDDAPAMRICFETEEGELHEYPLRLPVVEW
jgi:hypothetical protein